MTDEELWKAVGEELVLQRLRRHWKPIDIQKRGGPNYGTVQDIDRGKIGRVDRVEKYAKVLEISLVDVLLTILTRDQTVETTPELTQINRKFRTTTIAGRSALVALAAALPEEMPAASSGSHGVGKPKV